MRHKTHEQRQKGSTKHKPDSKYVVARYSANIITIKLKKIQGSELIFLTPPPKAFANEMQHNSRTSKRKTPKL